MIPLSFLGILFCLVLSGIIVHGDPVKWPDSPATPADENLAHASLKFSWDAYKALKVKSGDNVFFSPYSITTALSMLVLGSKGMTEVDLLQVLRVPEEMSTVQMHEELKAENEKLTAETNATFGIANRFFVDDAMVSKVSPKYSTNLKNLYNASLEPTPFAENPSEARKEINTFVSESTRGEIPNLLIEDPDVRTKLSLVNAIYFKGIWTVKFKPEETKKLPFHASSGDIDADFMHLNPGTILPYGECENSECKVVALPYTKEKKYAMIFIVPSEGSKLESLEANLDDQKLRALLKSIKDEPVTLTMPRFSMKSRSHLKDMIKNMGAKNIFGQTGAENSKIFVEEVHGTLVDDVIHEAKVEVNEEGTVAAAASATGITRLSVILKKKPEIVNLDRPFLFFIADLSNGFVLFFGRVENPTSSV